jgi:hypothetical protein
MQKACVFLLLLGIVALVAVESSSQGTQTQDEQKLREIESRTAKCEQQNDVSMMSLFADDFVVSGKKICRSSKSRKRARKVGSYNSRRFLRLSSLLQADGPGAWRSRPSGAGAFSGGLFKSTIVLFTRLNVV